MGKLYKEIDADLKAFIEEQRIFFVATAPIHAAGHVNLSPKGLDTFRVLASRKVAYLDHIGSGAETIAHLKENGRIVVMLCAMQGSPKIVRFHGRGEVLEPQCDAYQHLRPLFPATSAERAIIVVSIHRITDSCGFGVPLYRFERQRSQLSDWAGRKDEDEFREYQAEKNARSIDGLPAVTWVESAGSPQKRSTG
ncbi:MAG: Pyridoxamine 5-phosphate oxidase [Nitrospira sp.]|jgi:hypothetical protein|nr:Pyridoxamine 5-phosphate oxidase [Nitrospira sp.]